MKGIVKIIGLILVTYILLPAGCVWIRDGSDPFRHLYLEWFGFDGETTAYDYMKSRDLEASVYWIARFCDDGVCLSDEDWKCGFSISIESEDGRLTKDMLVDCFYQTVKKAPPYVNLDEIRKHCGRKYSVFVGEKYASKSECEQAHGTWGCLRPVGNRNLNEVIGHRIARCRVTYDAAKCPCGGVRGRFG